MFSKIAPILNLDLQLPEAVVQRCSVKRLFLEISQNSQENACARVSFLIKLQGLGEIFKNTFFTEHLQTTATDILPFI